MKFFQKSVVIALLVVTCQMAIAEILLYPFTDPVKEQRFNRLIHELRCPKCQNTNLAGSNAPLAVDLKDIIYEKIIAGESDQAITLYLKQRYGDFISYRPPVKPSTWLIWFGPFVVLLTGAILIFRFVLGRKHIENSVLDSTVSKSSKTLLSEWNNEVASDAKDGSQGDPQEKHGKAL